MTTQTALFPVPTASKPKAQGMPDWLLAQLEITTGGFRRTAAWTRCRKCNELTLQGLDDDICANRTTADPTPLTPQQEGLCQIIGRHTYYADIRSRTITLNNRDTLDIGHPARTPIIPEHKCGARFPTFLLQQPKGTNHDHPPF